MLHSSPADAIQQAGSLSEFLRGARASIPINFAVLPFGMLFGAVAVQNGLSVGEAVLMSASMFAGASQLVGLELFGQRIAPALILLSILAVNFRHVLYSAAFGRVVRHWTFLQKAVGFFFLTDPQFAQAEREHDSGRGVGFAWYFGLGLTIWTLWVIEAFVGAWFGNLLPNTHRTGIDFLLPIYFLGLLMDFRQRPLWLPVVLVHGGVPFRGLTLACHARRRGRHRGGGAVAHARGGRIMSDMLLLIVAGAMLTYLTRIGGHLVLSRFERVHPRVEQALNAVPAAVLTTLVAPATLDADPAEFAALAIAGLLALRFGPTSARTRL